MVPDRLRHVLQRREFTRTLGTPDKRTAISLAYPILAEWQTCMRSAEVSLSANVPPCASEPSDWEIEEAALFIAYEEAGRRGRALIQVKAQSGPDAFSSLREAFARRHGEALRKLHAGDHSYWRDRARRHAAKMGWNVPEDGERFANFVESLARCGADFFARAGAMVNGTDDRFEPSKFVSDAMERRKERAAEGEGIMALYDLYAAERLASGKKRQDSLNQDRVVVEGFARFVGSYRKLASITTAEVRNWRSLVATLPVGLNKSNVYSGLSLKEAAQRARETGAPTLSLITVNRYLSAISALFKWAKREGRVDANVCDGLFYDIDKQRNRRPPFNPNQLDKLLKSPLFTGFLRDGKEHLAGNSRASDWRIWIPLVCLFTGARISEIAQIRTGDVFEDDGHWLIKIAHEEKSGQTTKSGKSRFAPVHSILKQIGFLDYVKSVNSGRESDRDQPLFSGLERNERGQFGKASRFWREYIQKLGIKDGADGLGSHSFRHGLADQLRLAGNLDQEIAIILGHSQKSITAGYGILKQGTAARLSEIIEGAKFKGVCFDHLRF